MSVVDIICLANSRKLRGRCIAGLRTDANGWIRPVAPSNDGTLYSWHYKLSDGTDPQVLDVLRVDLSSSRPKPHQPENWLISNQRWQLVARPGTSYLPLLQSQVVRGATLLGNQDDRIAFDSFSQSPAQASLALVIPENLGWCVTTSFSGNRQIRAIFSLDGQPYNLAVTDPIWEAALSTFPPGYHRSTSVESLNPDNEIWLTISLGEPLNGDYCYKLVAAVLQIPRS